MKKRESDAVIHEMISDLRWPTAAVIALLAYFAGTVFAPLLYPYKMFLSDTLFQITIIQFRSLSQKNAYLGSYAFYGYFGLIMIFLTAYFLFKLRSSYSQIFYYISLGIYYGVMINGAVAGQLHASFDDAVRPWLPAMTRMPLYLVLPLVIMWGLPALVAYAAARIERVVQRR